MAYSRWTNSYWYTFGTVPDDETKAGQRFVICPYTSFSYRELTDNMDDCIVQVKDALKNEVKDEPDAVAYNELKGYMKDFIREVDEEFSEIEN